MAQITIEKLSFNYPTRKEKALDEISLSVQKGDFVLICGQSGCGKTTLIRQLKPEIAPYGNREGKILYNGCDLKALDTQQSAGEIGFVMQNPDNQIVTDKVWHELAFGLENLGVPTPVIRHRVAEMAHFFGIQDWFRKDVQTLSGGQKQTLNLASIMVMQPKLLLLDEPTAQLDPISAAAFLETVIKINREFATTVVLSEHRLEEIFAQCTQVVVMDQGRVLAQSSPKQIAKKLMAEKEKHRIFTAFPTPVRVFAHIKKGECPLTIREGHDWLSEYAVKKDLPSETVLIKENKKTALQLKDVWYRYEKNSPDVLQGVNLTVNFGEICCILGGNGAGKTTALKNAAGLYKFHRGIIAIAGKKIDAYKKGLHQKIVLLPQNPQTLFIRNTVKADLMEMVQNKNDTAFVEKVAKKTGIHHLLQSHPYDLSGGEQQKVALAKVLLTNASIFLLDEPTKGLDAAFKQDFAQILKLLSNEGKAIVMATHDIEFAAEYADTCALFFDGEVLSAENPRTFFSENYFYTTAANKMARHVNSGTILCREVVKLCQ